MALETTELIKYLEITLVLLIVLGAFFQLKLSQVLVEGIRYIMEDYRTKNKKIQKIIDKDKEI